jgi:hypothetical protein
MLEKPLVDPLELRRELVEHFADVAAVDLGDVDAVGKGAKRGRDTDFYGHDFLRMN